MKPSFKTVLLFFDAAAAQLLGCYLVFLWHRKDASPWLLVPAAMSLALCAWLLSLHPTASGRIYAAYGGLFVAMSVLWLWLVDKERPTEPDLIGAVIALVGMALIVFAPSLNRR